MKMNILASDIWDNYDLGKAYFELMPNDEFAGEFRVTEEYQPADFPRDWEFEPDSAIDYEALGYQLGTEGEEVGEWTDDRGGSAFVFQVDDDTDLGKAVLARYGRGEEAVWDEDLKVWHNFNFIKSLMDDEIREKLHMEKASCSEQEFFEAYKDAHLSKYGVAFPTIA